MYIHEGVERIEKQSTLCDKIVDNVEWIIISLGFSGWHFYLDIDGI